MWSELADKRVFMSLFHFHYLSSICYTEVANIILKDVSGNFGKLEHIILVH